MGGLTLDIKLIRLISFFFIICIILSGCNSISVAKKDTDKDIIEEILAESPLSVTEDETDIYFSQKNIIYHISKSNKKKEVLCVIDNAYNLKINNMKLYFLSSFGAYEYNLNNHELRKLWDEEYLSDDIGKLYINSFQISGENLIGTVSSQLVCYSFADNSIRVLKMNDGSTINVYKYFVQETKIYFVEHAEKTATIYCYNLNTGESEIVYGKGQSFPEDNQITSFTFVKNKLYYYKEDENKVLQSLDDTHAEDEQFFDCSKLSSHVLDLYGYYDNLYIVSCNDLDDNNVSGQKEYFLSQINLKNGRMQINCSFYSTSVPSEIEFINGYVFFTISSPSREKHAINLNTGKYL